MITENRNAGGAKAAGQNDSVKLGALFRTVRVRSYAHSEEEKNCSERQCSERLSLSLALSLSLSLSLSLALSLSLSLSPELPRSFSSKKSWISSGKLG